MALWGSLVSMASVRSKFGESLGPLRRSLLNSCRVVCVLSWRDPCFKPPRRVGKGAGNSCSCQLSQWLLCRATGASVSCHSSPAPLSLSLLQTTLMSPATSPSSPLSPAEPSGKGAPGACRMDGHSDLKGFLQSSCFQVNRPRALQGQDIKSCLIVHLACCTRTLSKPNR